MISKINSIKDDKIVLARELNSLKGRISHNKILLEGKEAVDWAIENGLTIDFILFHDKFSLTEMERYEKDYPVFLVGEGVLKKATDTAYLIPVVGVAEQKQFLNDSHFSEFLVVLDGVKDFGNIGTIVRTSSAFGVNHIISSRKDFDLFHKKSIEASRGKVFNTRFECFDSAGKTIEYLKDKGYLIISTSPRGKSIQSLVELSQRPVALIVGNETHGICDEFAACADILIQIPMAGDVESLNVGVAAGISIYELKFKQVLAMIEKNIKSTLGRDMNVASMLIMKALDVEIRKISNLTSLQAVFLMVLKCDVRMCVDDMRQQFGVLEKDTDAFLSPLLGDGLIVMEADSILAITDNGSDTLGKLWSIVEKTESKITAGMSQEEMGLFRKQLRQIQENCKAIIGG